MLTHPTLDKLRELRLTGMADALEEQLNHPEFQDLDFDERLGLFLLRNDWTESFGMGGRFSPESVVGILRNGWSESPEYPDTGSIRTWTPPNG